jgi:site-specific DNA-methyltransferase (adenine-specific)
MRMECMLTDNTTYLGDCLDLMSSIPDKSIDLILCDLPYGTTACGWDSIIPFEPLWAQYKRIIRDGRAIVLNASQPFTSALVMSNPTWFKYDWVWNKVTARGHLVAKIRPMAQHESVLVFGKGRVLYNPQMVLRDKPIKGTEGKRTSIMGGESTGYSKVYTHAYPKTIQTFSMDKNVGHPTQKPVALLEYLIRTYSDEGDLILDNAAGSGSTGVAAVNTGRRYIMMEKDEGYFDLINKRMNS